MSGALRLAPLLVAAARMNLGPVGSPPFASDRLQETRRYNLFVNRPFNCGWESSSVFSTSNVHPRTSEYSPGGAGGVAQPGECGGLVFCLRILHGLSDVRMQSEDP